MKLIVKALAVMVVGAFGAGASLAQVLERTVEVAQETVQDGARAQNQVNELDDQRERALAEYRAVLQQIERLQAYNDQIRRRIQGQEREIASLNDQISRVTQISRVIAPMITNMVEQLGRMVQADIPFLIDERSRRVQRLRSLLDDATVTEGEKYRLILQAFQIERDYGDSIEAYEGPLVGDDQDRKVTYVKYGRVALVYITQDGSEIGIWNHDARQWEPLDSSYAGAIQTAIRIAREQIPPDLVAAPVPGPTPVGQ